MKKLLTVLMISGLAYAGAQAQTERINACGVKHNKICRLSKDKSNTSCYKTAYASNFKVCKSENGYYICCETPDRHNSTFSNRALAAGEEEVTQYEYDGTQLAAASRPDVDMTIPQSQSYVMQSSADYHGNYPKNSRKGKIKVCYTGDNVAASTRAPYEGCPSPQSEGPEVNNYRNLNVSNPMPMPPLRGRAKEQY
jgi:hypothetical protein